MRSILVAILALLATACAPVWTLYGVPRLEPVDPSRNVWRSAQPETAAQWRQLAALGIRRDIILREPGEWPSDPHDALAAAEGIEVIEIPMAPGNAWEVFSAPSEFDTERAVSAAELGNAVLHCLHGQDRTGWVSMRYEHEALAVPKSVAWEKALDRGFHVLLYGLNRSAQDWLRLP